MYITQNFLDDYDNLINLLLVTEGHKTHYVLIKSISGLLYQNYGGHCSHICPFCPKVYRTKDELLTHLEKGCFKLGERSVLPSNEEAIDFVKFQGMKKMLKKPFVIYADFESILNAFDDSAQCGTKKYQKHIPCGYA